MLANIISVLPVCALHSTCGMSETQVITFVVGLAVAAVGGIVWIMR